MPKCTDLGNRMWQPDFSCFLDCGARICQNVAHIWERESADRQFNFHSAKAGRLACFVLNVRLSSLCRSIAARHRLSWIYSFARPVDGSWNHGKRHVDSDLFRQPCVTCTTTLQLVLSTRQGTASRDAPPKRLRGGDITGTRYESVDSGKGDGLESCSSGHNSDCVVYTLNITHFSFSLVWIK